METHTDYFVTWVAESFTYSIPWFVVFGGVDQWILGPPIMLLYLVAMVGSSLTSAFLLFRKVDTMIQQRQPTHGEPGPNV